MRVEHATVDIYRAFLKDKHRPPSKGGNTRARHSHVLTIAGETYSFLAIGAKKWVFAGDTVSFDWEWDPTHKYRNINEATVETRNAKGDSIARGLRGGKRWRTAEARMPASRREQRD